MKNNPKILVVGAGFAGSVCARELADAGFLVKIIDRRNHIGGNAWDEVDSNGFVIHPYGPHIFHTNSQQIFSWLSKFTNWRFYEHKVLAKIEDEYYPFPINRSTLNKFFKLDLITRTPRAVDSMIVELKKRALNSEEIKHFNNLRKINLISPT